jgi:hypothetical protein
MIELRRWEEEGATAEELALLRAARREKPDARMRGHALKMIAGVAVAGALARESGGALSTTKSAAVGWSQALAAIKVGLAVVAVAASGVAASRLAAHFSIRSLGDGSTANHPASGSPGPTIPAVSRDEEPVQPTAQTVVVAAPPLPAPSVRSARKSAAQGAPPAASPLASSPSPSASSARHGLLENELAVLERAEAVRHRDAREALRLLDEYRTRFPAGTMLAEERVLRVETLLDAGDRAAAEREADAFCSSHPDSPYARRLYNLARHPQDRHAGPVLPPGGD